MNTSEIVCLSQSERQTFDQKREVMTGNRLPRDPTALFDLADRIANSLAEKRPGVVRDLNAALELVTKLNAATYAYCVYLVIRHGAKHSAVARSFLSQAARTWHRKEKHSGGASASLPASETDCKTPVLARREHKSMHAFLAWSPDFL